MGREDGRASVVACVMWGGRGRGSPVCVSLPSSVVIGYPRAPLGPLPESEEGVFRAHFCAVCARLTRHTPSELNSRLTWIILSLRLEHLTRSTCLPPSLVVPYHILGKAGGRRHHLIATRTAISRPLSSPPRPPKNCHTRDPLLSSPNEESLPSSVFPPSSLFRCTLTP